ncbi:ComEC/Rec2 family competence protein [Bifidobacterium tibiigranuli]|jgi:ComEC/Rec2-related protein|uniref:ComEC/Rec2 family competence protein n=1 Tax=Bifidobacterium tibiigranuli TaxID=2172043 RepID=A0A5N6S0J4_9BIFI|nr:ComEC/Rec2 family competence protein [Bifidobacterium tibiigranuli]KAE8126543.1 ComEC/Rec2 family competence protein [Bifidobacterium tibiigranuli]KAE8126684.1 ComEC/Rec2 family competence protein [Bifidobacterium tibiigranuli]MCI1222070.1 ComEC/Rec2 family competence protein [Bifidobacterium tibiigranuli]MCI1232922.1 ComEC/Rec2 family competence protein [Bifidobacterium tibiigranuli]MCI1254900.1 ComEC/Rec2 family competence protein [Bifidobacterium tibiigranuli]
MTAARIYRNESLLFREQGSRDWRMLPAAIAVWMSCLLTWWVFDVALAIDSSVGSVDSGGQAEQDTAYGLGAFAYGMADGASLPLRMAVVGGVIVAIVAIAAVTVMRRPMMRGAWRMTGMLLACLALLGATSTWCSAYIAWRDPAMAQARASPGQRIARMRIKTPARTADIRQADCQADATLSMIGDGRVMQSSSHAIRVFASGADCRHIVHGATVQVFGRLEPSRFGKMSLWMMCRSEASVTMIRAPNPAQSVINKLQERFLAVTEGLSDQGRVLVPGLTIGLLGQEHVVASGHEAVDATYAGLLEDRFARSGIMHLMAVSGGHFVLVGALVRRLAAYAHAPRWATAALMSGAFLLLAALVYPSDSVVRALVMGLLGAAALLVGRRSQALSALCWTVAAVLIVSPTMARSYGFALSCTSVLGIVLFAKGLAERLRALLPGSMADAMAVTIAAQLLTLPIQVMMEPQLPLLSVPANLIVSPVVGIATMLGLASLIVAACSAELSFALAWVASIATAIMERCAQWLGGSSWVVLPWAEGWQGALLIAAGEAMIAAAIVVLQRRRRRRSVSAGEPGTPYQRRWLDPIVLWVQQLPEAFDGGGHGTFRGS